MSRAWIPLSEWVDWINENLEPGQMPLSRRRSQKLAQAGRISNCMLVSKLGYLVRRYTEDPRGRRGHSIQEPEVINTQPAE